MPSNNNISSENSTALARLAPSIVTLIALCLGLISIRYALDDKFEIAAALIIIAAILDGLDGRIARFLNSVSEFGAQIDSLADLVNFGISPGILMYLWILDTIEYKGLGWGFVLLFVCCAAIRLARFNTQLSSDTSDEKQEAMQNFIVGLPMPAAAVLTMLPLLYSFEIFDTLEFNPIFVGLYLLLPSFLMISSVPIFTGKKLHIENKFVPPVIVLICLTVAGSILEPWIFIPILFTFLLFSIPIGSLYFYKKYCLK